MLRIAVVAAHPDDEILGCAGTIRRHVLEGARVEVLILGEGHTSRLPVRRLTAAARREVGKLEACARAAARSLGTEPPEMTGLPDNRFDTVPMLDVVKTVEAFFRRVSPALVYTHHPGDLNVDHGITSRAVATAARPGAFPELLEIRSFEIPSSTDFAPPGFFPPFLPTLYVEITETFDAKIAALRTYDVEARPFPHPRSPEALEALARKRGSESGLFFAEAFAVPRRLVPRGDGLGR